MFSTAFGSYGYTQYFGSDTYFAAVQWLLNLLLGSLILYGLIHGPARIHGLMLLTVLCAGALMAVALWSSWTEDFQAQGRYMAPIIPMIGIAYYHLRNYISPWVVAAFTVSLCNFSKTQGKRRLQHDIR